MEETQLEDDVDVTNSHCGSVLYSRGATCVAGKKDATPMFARDHASASRQASAQYFARCRDMGLYGQTAGDESFDLRCPAIEGPARDGPSPEWLTVQGQRLLSFASCSYLGLQRHPALIEGAIEATRRWGTQFSMSRVACSAPPYEEVEELLCRIFAAEAVLVTASTTAANLTYLVASVSSRDAVVLDSLAHSSMHMAASLCAGRGTKVIVVPSRASRGDALALVAAAAREHGRVFFCCDGVYSMRGDMIPVQFVEDVLALGDNVHVYVDDAHGMSLMGGRGEGALLARTPLRPRLVVSTSLNKSFSAAGGCVIFPSREEREALFLSPSPLTYSGPLQIPQLGAAVASARLHLSGGLRPFQRALRDNLRRFHAQAAAEGIPLSYPSALVPICMVTLGETEDVIEVSTRLRVDEGLFVTPAFYPTVPTGQGGIRMTITAAHSHEEIDRAAQALARCVPERLKTSAPVPLQDADVLLPSESRAEAATATAAGGSGTRSLTR